MSNSQRDVRVFVSSTFRDMHAERDHLVTVVFPELRERVERLGLSFYDVDLRWGVPELGVDGESANSWEYCKQWIDRVEPFFVCILGERYGWIPPAKDIRDLTDRTRYSGLSVTEMEIRHAVLSGLLRRRSFFYFRRTQVPKDVDPALFDEFVDSAHEERLRRLKAEIDMRSGRPVRQYDCRWTGNGFADLDEFGQAVLEDLWSGVLRDEHFVAKSAWREALGRDPDGDARYTDESHPIGPDLWKKIVECATPMPGDLLDAETEAIAQFATGRLRWFQGRHAELAELGRFVRSVSPDASRLCVLRAEPGQGKSALLAKFEQELGQLSNVTRPAPLFISHFVGATERSADPDQLAERLVRELDRRGIPILDGKTDRTNFEHLLEEWLGYYDGERLIILLIDGVNQLTLTSRDGEFPGERSAFSWLPPTLGPKVRVILSCASADELLPDSQEHVVLSALSARQPEPIWIDLQPLDESDVRKIVVSYLAEYCKELDEGSLNMICRMDHARNPLYLMVMLSELRTLGGKDLNQKVPQLIAELAKDRPTAVDLFNWVLERMEVFGPRAVALWCGYLTLGRVGLTSDELAGLLSKQLGASGPQVAPRIERGLRRYLMRRGAQLDYFHGQLRRAVQRKYIDSDCIIPHDELTLRAHLEDFFRDRADPAQNGSFEGENPRDFTEMIHQQTAGRFWTGLDMTGRAFSALFDRDVTQLLVSCRGLVTIIEAWAGKGVVADERTLDNLLEYGSKLLRSIEITEELTAVLHEGYESDQAGLCTGVYIRWATKELNNMLAVPYGWAELVGLLCDAECPQIRPQIEGLLDQVRGTCKPVRQAIRTLLVLMIQWQYRWDELYAVIGCRVTKRRFLEKYSEMREVLPGLKECELIAEAEHERWHREMRAHGWTPGSLNPVKKQDPRVVPWADLDANAREDLVLLVQALPAALAEGKFVIAREEK